MECYTSTKHHSHVRMYVCHNSVLQQLSFIVVPFETDTYVDQNLLHRHSMRLLTMSLILNSSSCHDYKAQRLHLHTYTCTLCSSGPPQHHACTHTVCTVSPVMPQHPPTHTSALTYVHPVSMQILHTVHSGHTSRYQEELPPKIRGPKSLWNFMHLAHLTITLNTKG